MVTTNRVLLSGREAFSSNQPRVFHTDLPTQFFSFSFICCILFLTVKKPQNEKKMKKPSSEVSPLIFRDNNPKNSRILDSKMILDVVEHKVINSQIIEIFQKLGAGMEVLKSSGELNIIIIN